jgi:cyanate permease
MPEERSPSRGDGRWEALAIGTSLYVAFGVISTAIATLVTPIRSELGLSFTQMGVILGAWQFMYIVVALPLGLAIDRLGLRRALLVGAALVAASGLLRALALDFWGMLAAVALFGVGGPIISIGLPKLVATYFPPGARAVPTGIYITGVSLGSAIGLAATPSLLLPLLGGWREVYLVLGAFGVLVTVWWAVRGRERRSEAPAAAPPRALAAARAMLASRPVVLISLVGLTGFLITHGMHTWLPQLLEAKGHDPTAAGLLATVPRFSGVAAGLVAAQLAVALGGARAATLVVLVVSALSLVAFVPLTGGAPLVVVLLLVGTAPAAIMPLTTTLLMDRPEVGSARIGVAMGVFFAVGEIGGFGGPALLGLVQDVFGSFSPGILFMAGVTVATILPLLALGKERTAPAASRHRAGD